MMKSIGRILLVVALLCVWVGSASAELYEHEYTAPKMDNYVNRFGDEVGKEIVLTHSNYYNWGIDLSDIGENETITGASITFEDISSLTDRHNLYLNLLEDGPDGVDGFYSDKWNEVKDAYKDEGQFLTNWDHLSSSKMNETYKFGTDDLDMLVSYLLDDDSIGIGFDPDCHFNYTDITFSVTTTTSPVPVPASLGLLGLGFVGLVGLSRRRRKK